MSDVYLPAEDTAALGRALRQYRGDAFLEIGFGSGAVLAGVLPRFITVVGTDVLGVEQAAAAKGEADAVLADRAACFRDGVFDLVAFNPPYLPSDGIVDRAVDGGKGGLEVPLRFLEEALRVVRRDGKVLLLLSDEADLEEFARICNARGLSVEEKQRTPLFFESLVVFEVRRRDRST